MEVILYKPYSLFYVLIINMVQDMTHHIGIELNSEYYDISKSRIEHWKSSEDETIEKFF